MSEEKTPAAEPQSAQKESKVSMMMIVLLVILIWAVVAYFMTMTPEKEGETQQHTATTEQATAEVPAEAPMDAPAAVEATEKAAATAIVEAENVPAKDEKEAVEALMDVFAPEGK